MATTSALVMTITRLTWKFLSRGPTVLHLSSRVHGL